MAQHDYVIDNSTGANVRADINNVLQAIATNNSPVGSGHTNPPSTTFATSWFADIDAGIMKLRNTANTDYVNLFTLAGGVDVDAASNFNEDVTFQCASGTIVFDKSANDLTFSDSVKARFGDSNDLTIFHDGSNSHIEDAGTGSLLIKSDGVSIGASSGEFYFRGFENGASSLRFDNSQKLVTTTDGIQVTGEIVSGTLHCSGKLDMPDSSGATVGRVLLGDSDDLSLFHDGSGSFLQQNGQGNLFLQQLGTGSDKSVIIGGVGGGSSAEKCAEFINNGAVELYFDNSDHFHTTSEGVKVVSHGSNHGLRVFHSNGNEVAYIGHKGSGDEGNVILREGGTAKIILDCEHQRLSLGANSPMQISHNDSTTGTILMATGHSLIIRGADNTSGTPVVQLNPRGNHNGFEVKAHNGIKAYFDNSLKLETTAVGISSLDTLITHGELRPASDNNHSIGRSNRRYITIFAVNGSINTSDRNEKNTIIESDLGLDFINKLKPVSYKWNKDDGKTHYGLIAQDLEETILSLGKTISDFGAISKEKDSPMGLSYPQLLSPLIKAVQELSAKVAALEGA